MLLGNYGRVRKHVQEDVALSELSSSRHETKIWIVIIIAHNYSFECISMKKCGCARRAHTTVLATSVGVRSSAGFVNVCLGMWISLNWVFSCKTFTQRLCASHGSNFTCCPNPPSFCIILKRKGINIRIWTSIAWLAKKQRKEATSALTPIKHFAHDCCLHATNPVY